VAAASRSGAPRPDAPELSVVVPSHERPVRLRWLLNALEEQTLERDRWELVVVHDSGEDTERLLREHPLAAAGVLRHVRLARGTGSAARQRNVGWREARAPLIAFTDDDCRPEADWLERMLEAARTNPGAVIQGRTKPDPYEAEIMDWAPRPRSIDIDPPTPHAQTCNILYPRAALERVDGFDESIRTAGEDWDLAARAQKAGAGYVGEPRATVYHAVDTFSLLGLMRFNSRWQTLALVLKRHPEQRGVLAHGLFWKRRHALLVPALAGVALSRRSPALALLAVPYVRDAMPYHGGGPLGRARAAVELTGRAAVDLSELWAMVRGSARFGTLVL
jgi:GT2 family glycosyltransferase